MADILKLITDKDRLDYSENYNYETNFALSDIIPNVKTKNLKVAISKLVENGALPVMAQFHARDAEARIGDRTNYRQLEVDKLLIKEKLNQTERIIEFLGQNADDQEIVDFIYDDFSNLTSRVLTRAELAKNQVLSTGRLTINENNFVKDVDYGYPVANNISFASWSDKTHDIVGDLNALLEKATAKGKTITRALTSSKVVSYMVNNDGIKAFFEKSGNLVTKQRVLQWVYENFGIAFAINDAVYKTSATDKTTHRFFPENKISFFGGEGTIGTGFFAPTAEELALKSGVSERALVTLTQWEQKDPVGIWTKGSAIFIPVLADIEGLFIATVTK